MAIAKYSFRPGAQWRDLEEVSNRLARFFDQEAPLPTGRNDGRWMPAVNVAETREELILTADLPGMKDADLSVELENDVLTLKGEKAEVRTEGDEQRKYHVWERRFGSFQRSFTLPRTVTADGVTASYEAGVLTVRLPKHPEAKGRKIEIASN